MGGKKRKQGCLRDVSHCSRTSQGQEAGARLCSLEAHRERVPSLLHNGKETALTAGASDGKKATPASGMDQSDGGRYSLCLQGTASQRRKTTSDFRKIDQRRHPAVLKPEFTLKDI